jgi:hypothetical protein
VDDWNPAHCKRCGREWYFPLIYRNNCGECWTLFGDLEDYVDSLEAVADYVDSLS